MATVRPFRAVRYDERKAGPLADLVAPPYDVLGPAERDAYLERSPYNVVHLTLPDDYEDAGRLWRSWLDEGVLAADEGPALWWLSQTYDGPDGVVRTREGLVCALRVEPYSAGVVLPHERTHEGPKEGRLRLLELGTVYVPVTGEGKDGDYAATYAPASRIVERIVVAADDAQFARLWGARLDGRRRAN